MFLPAAPEKLRANYRCTSLPQGDVDALGENPSEEFTVLNEHPSNTHLINGAVGLCTHQNPPHRQGRCRKGPERRLVRFGLCHRRFIRPTIIARGSRRFPADTRVLRLLPKRTDWTRMAMFRGQLGARRSLRIGLFALLGSDTITAPPAEWSAVIV